MKKAISGLMILITILGCLCLCGCTKYTSSFKALQFVHSNTSKAASMTYKNFEGNYSFKMKTGKDADATLVYSGRTEGCDVTVYYDYADEKELLFVVKAGESVSGSVPLPKDSTVYVIVETEDKATSGDFSFKIE